MHTSEAEWGKKFKDHYGCTFQKNYLGLTVKQARHFNPPVLWALKLTPIRRRSHTLLEVETAQIFSESQQEFYLFWPTLRNY